MKQRSWCVVLLVLLALGAPRRAHAQRGIDVELFRPALDGYGIFTVDRAQVPHAWDFGFKLYTSFAGSPLRLLMTDEADPLHARSHRNTILERQLTVNLGAQLGLTDWLEVVLDMPVTSVGYGAAYGSNGAASDPMIARTGFYAGAAYTNVPPPNGAPLDFRLGAKARILRKGMFGFGAAAVVTLPFGDESAFLGDANFTFRPKLIADLTRGPITASINVGAIIRQETRVFDPFDVSAKIAKPRLLLDVGHELTWSAGVAWRFVRRLGVAAEVYGLVPLVGDGKDFTANVLGGLQVFLPNGAVLATGAGAGMIPSAARREDYRVFLGIGWALGDAARGASAVEGLDSDGDGVFDSQDACPNEAEDRDGFEDDDGCPDPDNDQDGILDRRDRCPNEAEDRDGFQDDDGCPEPDNDGDGMPDSLDKCPNEPEDRDGFQDDDGCPDADNDGDGIPDGVDACPNEPETRNGVDDQDGCPDTGGRVTMTREKLELPGHVQFESNRGIIAKESASLLNRVADKLLSNPQVKRVRIEGHADEGSSARRNQELSQARAEAVRDYLVRRGVEPERLQAVGYGNTRPLDPGRTPEARAKNRRVEFIIVEQ